jgi:hypothetical protein
MRRDDRLAGAARHQGEQGRDDEDAPRAAGAHERREPCRQRRNRGMRHAGAAIGAVVVEEVVLQVAEDEGGGLRIHSNSQILLAAPITSIALKNARWQRREGAAEGARLLKSGAGAAPTRAKVDMHIRAAIVRQVYRKALSRQFTLNVSASRNPDRHPSCPAEKVARPSPRWPKMSLVIWLTNVLFVGAIVAVVFMTLNWIMRPPGSIAEGVLEAHKVVIVAGVNLAGVALIEAALLTPKLPPDQLSIISNGQIGLFFDAVFGGCLFIAALSIRRPHVGWSLGFQALFGLVVFGVAASVAYKYESIEYHISEQIAKLAGRASLGH